MYLSKQWRESRIISGIALLGLVLLLMTIVKGSFKIDSKPIQESNPDQLAGMFVALFYTEAVFIAFWGWLVASIGIGKNLGEESGSFLFTRPRRRAWFLWSDWGFGMAQLALIILLANLMIGFFMEHVLVLMHSPGRVQLNFRTDSVPLVALMLLIGIGALLFSGLVYSLTYFSTVMMKRASGVITGAGIFVGYLVLRLIISHYYPSAQLPNPIPGLFDLNHHGIRFSDHLARAYAARAVLMLLFPLAAQVILDRSEI